MKQQLGEKYQQVKEHVKERREIYIAVGVTAVVSVAGTLLVVKQGSGMSQRISGLIVWKPEQTIISLVDPGDIILVKETGEKIRSKNAAAHALGISRPQLSKLGEGETGTFGRWTLTNIGKARTE